MTSKTVKLLNPVTSVYKKSYEREYISWFMGVSNVLKVSVISRTVNECDWKLFKAIWLTDNYKKLEQLLQFFVNSFLKNICNRHYFNMYVFGGIVQNVLASFLIDHFTQLLLLPNHS